ncbi:MAG: hypothetical protein ACRDQF_18470 [Thermocrispum sp.]
MAKNKARWFAISAGMIVVGVLLLVIPFGEVESTCAPANGVTSGYVDEDKGCPISVESFEAIREEMGRPKIERIAGLLLIVGGLGLGITTLVRGRSANRQSPASPIG